MKGQIKTINHNACEYIITSDKKYFNCIGIDETKRYFETAYKFVCKYKNLREQYILSSKVHMDEGSLHMHLVFIPVVHTKDKKRNFIDKIACSEFWKVKDSYRQLQDSFYNYMVANNFELEQGNPSERVHLTLLNLIGMQLKTFRLLSFLLKVLALGFHYIVLKRITKWNILVLIQKKFFS